jgi:hypothetical protein
MLDHMVQMRESKAMLGVSSRTLCRYTASGKLPDRRSPGGHRIFSVAELEAILHRRGAAPVSRGAGAVVLYARVSSRRQPREGDLERQSRPEKWCSDHRVIRPRSYAASDAGRASSVPWRASGNLAGWILLRASALMYRRCSAHSSVLLDAAASR